MSFLTFSIFELFWQFRTPKNVIFDDFGIFFSTPFLTILKKTPLGGDQKIQVHGGILINVFFGGFKEFWHFWRFPLVPKIENCQKGGPWRGKKNPELQKSAVHFQKKNKSYSPVKID